MDTNNLTFGNYPVELAKIDDDVIITCKGVTGKFSQVRKYLQKTKGEDYPYEFSESIIVPTVIGYKIACLRGTKEESEKIIEACNKLLNNK